jgi:hypothetical protein
MVFLLFCSTDHLSAQIWHNQAPVSIGINTAGGDIAQSIGIGGLGWNLQAGYLYLIQENDLFLKGNLGYASQSSSNRSELGVSILSGTIGIQYLLSTKTFQPFVGADIGFASTSNSAGSPSQVNATHGIFRVNVGLIRELNKHIEPFVALQYTALTGDRALSLVGFNAGVNIRITD